MKYKTLGRSDLNVSQLCLGSMTWGTQNTEAEGHQQIDMALDGGINFIDSAEMYPVNPISAQTQGDSERILGSWFEKTGRRKDVILATKISGVGPAHIRNGSPITSSGMKEAVEGSLERLKTDVIDLYQLHWPNRGSYHFRKAWTYDPTDQNREEMKEQVSEILNCAAELIKDGKIRYIGLSNESCWGTSQFLEVSQRENLPRVVSIQNEYSLMCRIFDLDLAELAHNEEVDLLAFSPLATGLLTGKYLDGVIPAGSRRSLNDTLGGRFNAKNDEVVRAYQGVAEKHGLTLPQLSLAFCMARPFMGSAIFGSTTNNQLEVVLSAQDIELSADAMADITEVYRQYPMPY